MWLLAQILTEITGETRRKVVPGTDFQWSRNSWVHNVFRLYEIVFWRRYGIRAEMSTWVGKDGRTYHVCHSWESAFALLETKIREALSWSSFAPVRIWIPILQLPNGQRFFGSPYLFAIAFDAQSASSAGLSPQSTAHTITGSNTLLLVHATSYGSTGGTVSGVTYNSVAMTIVGSLNSRDAGADHGGVFQLAAPTTGANNITITATSTNTYGEGTSYSGVSQASPIDNHRLYSEQSGSTPSGTLTPNADNCWVAMGSSGSVNLNSMSVGTLRGNANGGAMGDTNAAISPAAATTLTFTGTTTWEGTIVSIAPAGAAAASTRDARELTLLGVG